MTRHTEGVPGATAVVLGLRVTTLARTVVDVARTGSLTAGVVAVDAALAPGNGATASADHLLQELVDHPSARGRSRAFAALELGDGRSQSVGESVSRASMYRLGFHMPELQKEFVDDQGSMWVDFWWPELNLVGEFDGETKYTDPAMLRGRTTAEVLVAEKWREDRLRALGLGVVRWGWDVATSLPLLRARLSAAGLRDRRAHSAMRAK
ncbi:hypothetical protein [Diaminobutyricimonas aerilata]|uniref:hypothetical protein n=1 Tax=Diaminobutyricimonas aerilata TaxID=1162967 RepID=UPI000C24FB5D|nr:hypothetical protein [Diaminobutyricimonas aerilata]